MATYKVIQDIEAEDKILGPLTLRQFIYTLIACFFLYLCFISFVKGFAWALTFLLPPALFTGFLAFPFGRDQPTEVWAVAKFSFLFKPRKRIWDQSGVKELVTINVPKKVERIYTNGLSQTEVKSRLSALANTIDSRGWAIKNVNVNLYAQPGSVTDSDRLVAMSSIPQIVPEYTIQASEDILDEHNNPIAQQFTQMISASTQAHRQHLMDVMNSPATEVGQQTATAPEPQDMWFAPKVEPQVLEPATPYAPIASEAATPTADEQALIERIKAESATTQTYNSHMHVLQPISDDGAYPAPTPGQSASVPAPAEAVEPDQTLRYLALNNDRSVDSLGRERQAQKAKQDGNLDQGEVVVSLR